MTGALLMYHGLADRNVGTDPTNSLRLYHALIGLGKTTALYLYPLEDHGPASKEHRTRAPASPRPRAPRSREFATISQSCASHTLPF